MAAIFVKNKDYQRLGAILAGRLGGRLAGAEWWARVAAVAGMVVVALALAQLTWRVVPQHESAIASAPQATGRGTAVAPVLGALADSHLFGLPQALPGSAISAPETTLNLTLHGIIAIDSERALAIIASGGGSEQPYKVGDSLPGGARLHEIVADRVILERGGRFETLTLPKDDLDSAGGPGSLPGQAASRGSGSPGAASRLGEIRSRLRANPAEVVGMNALQPVMENGQLKGYQLGDNPYTPALREAGLMPGDVVTRVNGIAVTDQARAAEMVNQLSTASHIEVEVERGGVVTSLSVDLSR